MARRTGPSEPVWRPEALELPDLAPRPDRSALFAFLGLMTRPCPTCTIEEHLAAVHREMAAQAEAIADGMVDVLDAVLDGLSLTPEQREHGIDIAQIELRKLAGMGR